MNNPKITNVKEAIFLLSDFLAESEQQYEKESIDALDSTSQEFWRLQKGSLITTKNTYQTLKKPYTHSKRVVLPHNDNKLKEKTTEMKKLKY